MPIPYSVTCRRCCCRAYTQAPPRRQARFMTLSTVCHGSVVRRVTLRCRTSAPGQLDRGAQPDRPQHRASRGSAAPVPSAASAANLLQRAASAPLAQQRPLQLRQLVQHRLAVPPGLPVLLRRRTPPPASPAATAIADREHGRSPPRPGAARQPRRRRRTHPPRAARGRVAAARGRDHAAYHHCRLLSADRQILPTQPSPNPSKSGSSAPGTPLALLRPTS